MDMAMNPKAFVQRCVLALIPLAAHGCVCADLVRMYTIDGQLVDAETGEPFAVGTVGVRLLHEDREVALIEPGFWRVQDNGAFSVAVPVSGFGYCSPLGLAGFFVPAPSRPEVDTIEIIVSDRLCRRVVVIPVNEGTIEDPGISDDRLELKEVVLVEPC
jgi:hypothetical protein